MSDHACGQESSGCHQDNKGKIDLFLWSSITGVVSLYIIDWFFGVYFEDIEWFHTLSHSVFELMNTIWWGIVMGISMVAILAKIPREFVLSILGTGSGLRGIFRATMAGVLLDLCSHGILMVGAKLYERGASAGQVIAFLVASPWNSFSLTLILIALIGWKWMLAFIILSMIIAIIAGLLFDRAVNRGVLPANPNKMELPEDFDFWPSAKAGLKLVKFDMEFTKSLLHEGYVGSKPVLRWILFGVLLASVIRAFMDEGSFQTWFGPSLVGLAFTVVAATIIEVCSEGSAPIAADLLNRADAPGNSFAFLMTGVSTDYTEIMVLKETTKSWRFAFYLPLVTLPQVIAVAWVMNVFSIA